jgi:hypothetical protein
MHHQDNNRGQIAQIQPLARQQAGRAKIAQVGSGAGWQMQQTEDLAMQSELSNRVLTLTDRMIAPDSIYVDRAARLASVVVDGVLLRGCGDSWCWCGRARCAAWGYSKARRSPARPS